MSTPRVRPNVERMAGYRPGEQPGPGEQVVKLNTNENPFPPGPRVMEAIREIDPEWLRRYPAPHADAFRAVAARVHGVSADAILAGNGSDDILQIALRTFCGTGQVLAYPHPTYSLYPVLADLAEVRVITVPWDGDWRLPVDALVETQAQAIFFANPNSPSGTVVSVADVEALANRTDALVLVDEAYVDFAEVSCLELAKQQENVLVARSLSKGYSLAGLRFGYAVGAPSVITQMLKVKDSYNCDAVSIAAACAALDDRQYAERSWAFVRSERGRLSEALARRGFWVIPSQANFVLATTPGARPARSLYAALKQRGVFVRVLDEPGLEDKLRITVGTQNQNDALLAALDRVLLET